MVITHVMVKVILCKIVVSKFNFFYCRIQFSQTYVFQYWMMFKTGEIRRDDVCLDYSTGSNNILTYECHGRKANQEWLYTNVSSC